MVNDGLHKRYSSPCVSTTIKPKNDGWKTSNMPGGMRKKYRVSAGTYERKWPTGKSNVI